MITTKHQQLLREAVETNEKEAINAVFQKVLREEIGAMRDISNITQDYLYKVAEQIAIPFKPEIRVLAESNTDLKKVSLKNELVCLIICLVALVGMTIIGAEVECGKTLGICLSFVIVMALYFYTKTHPDKREINRRQPQIKIEEIVDADVLIDIANKVIGNLRNLVEELAHQGSDSQPPTRLPLYECYPNILNWLQTIYSDCLDFDDRTKGYMLKRIEGIARQCYYDIVPYDGDNMNMFEINKEIGLEEPKMISPAVVYSKTGLVVLPGIIAVPNKLNSRI